jgi:hypothetical protein
MLCSSIRVYVSIDEMLCHSNITWLLSMMYVCLLFNNLASAALGWKSPEQVLTGQTPDILKFMHFSFYEPVYYNTNSNHFPSASNEEKVAGLE